MYLECPDSIRVNNTQILHINGVYSITNQVRRQRPVWYNKIQDKYIFVSTNWNWHIATSNSYNADNKFRWAHANLYKNGKACPHDRDYWLWINNKWTRGTDLSVTSGSQA